MTWLVAAVLMAVACWLLYRTWVRQSRDYDAIEHRTEAMRVLGRMHRSESDHRKGGERDEDAAGEG